MCSSRELHHSKRELNPRVLHPWRSPAKGVVRVKRDWIIPPIRVLENSKQVPEDLVQVTGTKAQLSAGHDNKCLTLVYVWKMAEMNPQSNRKKKKSIVSIVSGYCMLS